VTQVAPTRPRKSTRIGNASESVRRSWRVTHADCLVALPELDSDSVDVVITDPPYGINMVGMSWDRPSSFQAFSEEWGSAALRVLKPGGHLAAFGAPRTAHRLACGLEDAGFELRDVLMWLYGQGIPKSLNLTGQSAGWGTALKPAYEPILLARKRVEGTIALNHVHHRTGALHIDAVRVSSRGHCPGEGRTRSGACLPDAKGRWPTNLAISHAPLCTARRCEPDCSAALLGERQRFFYCPKATRGERDAGCEALTPRLLQGYRIDRASRKQADTTPVPNIHPTVKPLELMRWLVRLLAAPGGLVLDPFAGSGSTGAAAVLEGARFLGIEREDDYVPIARARIEHWSKVARERRQGSPRQPRSGRPPTAKRRRS
jgi:DNA modification methylase